MIYIKYFIRIVLLLFYIWVWYIAIKEHKIAYKYRKEKAKSTFFKVRWYDFYDLMQEDYYDGMRFNNLAFWFLSINSGIFIIAMLFVCFWAFLS